MDTRAFVDKYLNETSEICARTERDEVARFIQILFDAWRARRQVFTMGNGGSASTATHFAADIAKFTWVEGKPRFRCFSLCDNPAYLSALTNDNGFDSIFVEQLEPVLEKDDVLIGISVHGGKGRDKAGLWSQNLLRAVDLAKRRGARVLGLAGFDGGALKELADACIVVPARSTPHVEGMHVVYHHLVVQRLLDLIKEAA
ncbi:MAG TPA: SIS domain-containing protein [Polyangia bacterium]|nr:SIS domain-containing protein [Polyangia bacterium]